MSVADLARLLSEAVVHVESVNHERMERHEPAASITCAMVTLYARSSRHGPQGMTAVVCLNCVQIYLGVPPAWCACGTALVGNGLDLSALAPAPARLLLAAPTSASAQTRPLMALYPTVDLLRTNQVVAPSLPTLSPIVVTGWEEIETSIAAVSPYISLGNTPAPPPPPAALLSKQQGEDDAGRVTDVGIVIALSLVMLGFLIFLRLVLVL